MEPVHGELKASKCQAEDFISSMPDNVITKILNGLPLRVAVRTGILSRTWRFKWTLITKLIFDDDFYNNLRGRGGKPSYNGKDLSRLINQLKGPITKFYLEMPKYILFDDEDVNHWLSVLSRKGIKELNIINMIAEQLELPTQLFSCLELKHLLLHNFSFHLPPTFCGFPKLWNLDLSCPKFEQYMFGELIARCPLLEALRIDDCESIEYMEVSEIAKNGNLKMLKLDLCALETCSSIFQLADLPKLEQLDLDFGFWKFFGEAGNIRKVRTGFLSLKTLNLSHVDFNNQVMVTFVSKMICSSQNLLNLTISTRPSISTMNPDGYTLPWPDADPNTMGMLPLRNVLFSNDYYVVSGNEMHYIKYLLACSPLLEKFVIRLHSVRRACGENRKVMFTTKSLDLPRASPMAEVVLQHSIVI